MNGLNNFDETDREYLLTPTDDSRGQQSRSHLGSSIWWRRHPRWLWGVDVPSSSFREQSCPSMPWHCWSGVGKGLSCRNPCHLSQWISLESSGGRKLQGNQVTIVTTKAAVKIETMVIRCSYAYVNLLASCCGCEDAQRCSVKYRRVREVDWSSKWRQSKFDCFANQFLWLYSGSAGSRCQDVSISQGGNVLYLS